MWMQDCSSCTAAKENGLQAWMHHLTEQHVIPTEWPSERMSKLTGAAALRPYTMITESKKKRRKDAVPRPLNSFMLFAQHIRRNVLRVFSDASNSVISQQLGDMWRTVQQDYRTQYDEEANRLVKIHQLEFPTYKYQPKKRHLSTVQNGSSVAATRACHPIASTAKVHNSNSKAAFDSTSVSRPRLASINGTVVTLHTINAPRTISDTSKTLSTEHLFRASPHKYATAFKVSSTNSKFSGTKPSSSPRPCPSSSTSPITSSTTIHNKYLHSLSSVLPPLLTSSKQLQYSLTDPFQFPNGGSCDSAYGSGISSSSSSSASSPVVGDLISPNKTGIWNQTSGLVGCLKSSPIRHRLQFVPIRPQSSIPHVQVHQQATSAVGQPARQRFLSANDGSSTSVNEVSSIPCMNDENVYLFDQVNSRQLVMSEDVQANSISPPVVPRVHQLTAPMYVKLNSDSGTNEDVILALPPGTTIIQPLGDFARLPRTQTLMLAQQALANVQPEQNAPVQFLLQQSKPSEHPLQPANFRGSNCQPKISTHLSSMLSNHCSPIAYSSGSCSSSSAWSPLPTEVFVSTQQSSWNFNSLESNVVCQSNCLNPLSSSPSAKVAGSPPLPISEAPGVDFELIGMEIDIADRYGQDSRLVKTRLQNTNFKTEEMNEYCLLAKESTKAEPPQQKQQQQQEQQQDSLLSDNFDNLGTLKQHPVVGEFMERGSFSIPTSTEVVEQCGELVTSDYIVGDNVEQDVDDQFDCSLDAMMNSIDITTFLPGTFSANEEQMTDAYIDEVDCTVQQYHPSTTKCDVIDLCDHVDPGFLPDSYFTTISVDLKSPLIGPDALNKNYSASPIHSHLQHSPLADLDALDKSSLFIVKPELPLGLCQSC